MPDIFAILYAPDTMIERENRLIQKLNEIVECFNIEKANIRVNAKLPIDEYWKNESKDLITVIIWGFVQNHHGRNSFLRLNAWSQ